MGALGCGAGAGSGEVGRAAISGMLLLPCHRPTAAARTAEGAAAGEESSAALQLLARQAEELRGAQARALRLENDNVQLQARVSALERAHTAQATAMLSCLEESERVRLQQLSISVCESPVGPLADAHARMSEFTDDSGRPGAYTDALELGSDGSYVSCLTGSGGGGQWEQSIFHSCSPSPDRPQQAAQQQQQQQGQPAGGSGGKASSSGSAA